MRYQTINKSLFEKNRANFSSKLQAGSVALFHSNDLMPRNGDAFHKWKQNSDLFYLSGVDQEETILLLFPDCPYPEFKEVLFIRQTSEQIAIWEGHKLTKEEATAATGIQKIYWYSEFAAISHQLILMAENIYINLNENDRFASQAHYNGLDFAMQIKSKYPAHTIKRSAPILGRLRSVKSEIEIELIRHACEITEKAHRRILGFIKPGVMEYQIDAEIMHEFINNRSSGHAYEPIIASGANACVLHYIENNAACNAGEVILLDYGAEYANYCADLSRSVPVSGKFTARQKDVYNAVLRVQKGAMAMLKPGAIWRDYQKEVGELMSKELVDLGLISLDDIKNQNPEWPAYKKYFMHGTSHHLGLDVHDFGLKWEPMAIGNVFTVEPGIYIPEENLGIRIENNVVITANGLDDLMANIPVEVDEIESLMNA